MPAENAPVRRSPKTGCFKQILFASPACLIFLPLIMTWKLTIAIGVGVVAFAGWLGLREHTRLRASQIVTGTVVRIDRYAGSGKSAASYQPHVRYTTRDGTVREFVPYTSGDAGVKINQEVIVAYEDAAQTPRLLTFGQRFGLATFLAVFGAALIALGAAFLAGRHYVPRFYRVDLPMAPSAESR
jgi:hypothetical protein